MDRKDVKRAAEIDRALDIIQAARKTAPVKNEKFEEYWCSISQHKDGSGWKMDLTGALMAGKVVTAIHCLLDEEERLLKEELGTF